MLPRITRLAASLLALSLATTPAPAQATRAALDSSINKMLYDIRNVRIDDLLGMWTANVSMYDGGHLYPNRDAVHAVYAPIFHSLRAQDIRVENASTTLLSPTAALYVARGHFTGTDTAGATSPLRGFAWSILWRAQGGRWMIDYVQQHIDPMPAAVAQAGAPAHAFTSTDSSAIAAVLGRMQAAAIAGNWTAWEAEYVANPVRLPPNMQPLVGSAASHAFDASSPQFTTFTVIPTSIVGDGDVAVASGTWSAVATSMNDNGQFMQVLRRQPDGSWKIERDIWNSSLPLTH